MRRWTALGIALALLAAVGCGTDYQDEPPGEPKQDVREADGIDPRPEKLSGEESTEFEEDDLRAAENAGRLVELYCEGVPSEAQYLGCLSHVSDADVCEQDTDARAEAVAAYVEETGTDPCE